MPTECSRDLFGFAPVEGREVVAAFDGGAITSDAGALLLGATDRAIGMMERFAACFHDERRQHLIEHEVVTLLGQRVFGIALGYEDLNDHDELRHDPMMAVLAGRLEARREDCAPVAGKSTLNRLELSKLTPTRYHKISHNPMAIRNLFVDLFLEAHARPPRQIILDLDATDDPVHGEQEGRFFHGYYDCYCYLPLYIFCGRDLLASKLRTAAVDAAAGAVEEVARVVAKAEWTKGEANPRFVVTSLARNAGKAKHLYEKIYCARGEMENRIKECQLDLYADRTSAATMRANQLRLWFASMAYVLLCATRRIALHDTNFAQATCGTIRLKLLKIGALVRISVRRIKFAMASACPAAHDWRRAAIRLAIAAIARASPALHALPQRPANPASSPGPPRPIPAPRKHPIT